MKRQADAIGKIFDAMILNQKIALYWTYRTYSYDGSFLELRTNVTRHVATWRWSTIVDNLDKKVGLDQYSYYPVDLTPEEAVNIIYKYWGLRRP